MHPSADTVTDGDTDGEKITTRVNGVWRDLKVIRPWDKDSDHFYNYYSLETLDGEDRVRINLE